MYHKKGFKKGRNILCKKLKMLKKAQPFKGYASFLTRNIRYFHFLGAVSPAIEWLAEFLFHIFITVSHFHAESLFVKMISHQQPVRGVCDEDE